MYLEVTVRPERKADLDGINETISSAFLNHPHSNHKEHLIVSDLRESLSLDVSLVADVDDEVIGHIAFSKVMINGQDLSWYGLAPVSVHPKFQNSGVGSKLIRQGLETIKELGAKGCVLLGEPQYYERFGFKANASLILDGVRPEYFLTLSFSGPLPSGKVGYNIAFANNG